MYSIPAVVIISTRDISGEPKENDFLLGGSAARRRCNWFCAAARGRQWRVSLKSDTGVKSAI